MKEQRGTRRAVSIAPMMDRTDRHYRYFMRQMTRHSLLYSEMITCKAIIHGDRERLLGFDPIEKPLVLQVGGDNPSELAVCAQLAEDWGYDEININVGCPSNRVQAGNFGVCLMGQPDLVAESVSRMRAVCSIPVTVKHRIGFDELDKYEDMLRFVTIVAAAGADRFTIHARKAWLQGLSPKENRNVPPLRYEDVYRLKRELPHLDIEINGGVKSIAAIEQHLQQVDAVMIGRMAYEQPWMFASVDRHFFGDQSPQPSRQEVAEKMIPYVEQWIQKDGRMLPVTRHMLQLFAHCAGARRWRRELGQASNKKYLDIGVIKRLLADPIFGRGMER